MKESKREAKQRGADREGPPSPGAAAVDSLGGKALARADEYQKKVQNSLATACVAAPPGVLYLFCLIAPNFSGAGLSGYFGTHCSKAVQQHPYLQARLVGCLGSERDASAPSTQCAFLLVSQTSTAMQNANPDIQRPFFATWTCQRAIAKSLSVAGALCKAGTQ